MTARARWLMFFALAGLLAGVNRAQPTVVLLSLAVFIWIIIEWICFQARLQFQLPQLKFRRFVNGRNLAADTLWSGRRIAVDLRLQSERTISPDIEMVDVVPEIFACLPGKGARQSNPAAGRPPPPSNSSNTSHDRGEDSNAPSTGLSQRLIRSVSWVMGNTRTAARYANEFQLRRPCRSNAFSYTLIARSAGQVSLPGLKLTVKDRFGFFETQRFIDLEQRFLILPAFHKSSERQPGIKRYNSLPRHGIHRLQRAGAGSELLELREYSPGDPPKSIAWKVSARRDQLMTRQYESEVPVRVRLFIDGSPSARTGGFGMRMLDQSNYVAASVARAATAVGDPVSGMLIDRDSAQSLPWHAGDQGFLRFMKALAEFSLRPPPSCKSIRPGMLRSVLSVLQTRYPELLDRRYYRQPFSFSQKKSQRDRVTTLLAEVFNLTAWEQARCYLDEALLSSYMQRLLFEFGTPWMAPLVPPLTQDLEADPRNVAKMAAAMSRAIAHARDNEVFVVFSSVSGCAAYSRQLVRVAKLALAKHHRVAFVFSTTTFARPESQPISLDSAAVPELLRAAERAHVRELSSDLKRELTRIGAAVSFSGESSAIRMVLDEIDRARDGRTRQSGVRR